MSKNLNGLIDRIICKKIYFIYKDNIYYYKYPNSELKLQSSLLYEDHFEKLKYENSIVLEEDIDYYLTEYDVDDGSFLRKSLESLNKKLENLKIDLYHNFYKTKDSKQIRAKITTCKKNIEQAEARLHYLDRLTIENICANIQNEFLLINGIYDNNHSLYFNYNNLDEIDQQEFQNMIHIVAEKFLTATQYRSIARSNEWKSLWNIKNYHIFSEPIIEWSEEQKTLVSFSQMYDNIYQHMECPEEDIINDDDALDGWSLYQNRKNQQEKKQKGVTNMLDKHKNAQEIFLVAESDDELQHIIGLNDDAGLMRMKNTMNFVASQKGKPVPEIYLPDVQQDLLTQMRNKKG